MQNKNIYTINGQVANLCNVSTKQLRYYDNNNITAKMGTSLNNYRYYTQKQIEEIVMVQELK